MDYIGIIGGWFLSNLNRLISSVIMIIVGYAFYRIVARQIKMLESMRRLEEHLAYILIRIFKWGTAIAVVSAVLAQWGVAIGVITGLVAVSGGTIIGFAAINTLGNAVAGIIVMTSRPFDVGDRIFFKNQFVDVVSIGLIYTKMLTLDNVLVSVPNQELLKTEINDYGKKKAIRRHVTVTPDFKYDSEKVREALLEAARNVKGVLKDPKPYVWITRFQNYAVEYNLYAFIDDIKRLPEIDAELHEEVLITCNKYRIDISTPLLLRQMKDVGD